MIALSFDGPLALLTLDRPSARNAIPTEGWETLASLADELTASAARAVILRSGAAGIFSAGADIGEFPQLQADPARRTRFRRAMAAAMEGIAALPMPVIAAVDGGCFGAAVALALSADLRIAGEGAQFATTPAKLGLGYPRGDVARLVARVGQGQAARMLFTGGALDAAEALRIGLVELTAPNAEVAARELAARIAANAPGAVCLLKRTLASPADDTLDATFEAMFGSAEFAEGLAAFQARRKPVFG